MPKATQWEVVEEAAEMINPAHDELIRQAAQGEVLHNDDTSMRVLHMEREPSDERTGVFTAVVLRLFAGAVSAASRMFGSLRSVKRASIGFGSGEPCAWCEFIGYATARNSSAGKASFSDGRTCCCRKNREDPLKGWFSECSGRTWAERFWVGPREH